MSTATLKKATLLIVAVAVSFTSAFAHEERHERRDNRVQHKRMERRAEHRQEWRAHERDRQRHDHERWAADHRRDSRRPNGWDQGRKNGWRGHDVPPGQAKKDGAPFQAHNDSGHPSNGRDSKMARNWPKK